jgi:DNA-binding SARP family transcriptional activator
MATNAHMCRLHLLGFWALDVGSQRVHVGSREQRVLTLLALRGPQARASAAGILWPDTTDARARASLRTSLKHLRGLDDTLISTESAAVAFGCSVDVDVWELFVCLERVERMTRADELDLPDVLATLEGAALLPGWFDDWVLFEREHLHHRRIRALERIAAHLLDEGDPTSAIAFAEAALSREPLLESAASLVIRAHLDTRNQAAAVQVYRQFRRQLGSELGIAPSRALTHVVSLATGLAVTRSS